MVIVILFPEKSWAGWEPASPGRDNSGQGMRLGGGAPAGLSVLGFNAPGRARADCLSARPPAGRCSDKSKGAER